MQGPGGPHTGSAGWTPGVGSLGEQGRREGSREGASWRSGFRAQTRSEENTFILDSGCLLQYLLYSSTFCFTEKGKTTRVGVGQAPEGLAGQKQRTAQEQGKGGGAGACPLETCPAAGQAGAGRAGQKAGEEAGAACRGRGRQGVGRSPGLLRSAPRAEQAGPQRRSRCCDAQRGNLRLPRAGLAPGHPPASGSPSQAPGKGVPGLRQRLGPTAGSQAKALPAPPSDPGTCSRFVPGQEGPDRSAGPQPPQPGPSSLLPALCPLAGEGTKSRGVAGAQPAPEGMTQPPLEKMHLAWGHEL